MRQDDSNNKSRTKSVLYQADTSQYDNMSLIELLQAILDGADQHGLYRLALMKKTRRYTERIAKPFLTQGSISPSDLDSLQFITICEVTDSLKDDAVPILKQFYALLKWKLIANIVANADHESAVHLPSNLRLDIRKYRHFIKNYKRSNGGNTPDDATAAKALKMSVKQLHALQQAYLTQWPEALDATIKADDEGQELTIADTLADDFSVEDAVTDCISLKELRAAILTELEELPEDQRKAIRNRYFNIDGIITDKTVLHDAMRNLCRPERMRRLSQYTSNFYGGGWESFKVSFTSRPEAIAIRHDTRGNEK